MLISARFAVTVRELLLRLGVSMILSVSNGLRGCTRVGAVEQRCLRLLAGSIAAAAVLSLGVGASGARQAKVSGQMSISMIANSTNQPGYDVLIANFERVYPNITVNITYASSTTVLYQLETIELAAGNAPDLLTTNPGCGTLVSICTLAKSGYLAAMVKKPWVKWSLPLVTSLDKYGQGLFAFTPQVAPYAIFTNDGLFSKLGLKIPQTFSQLLDVCQKAKAAGTAAVILPGADSTSVKTLLTDLAVATVYGKDKQWAGEQRAGTVTFDGSSGWHQALQEFIDMNNTGCFQPGAAGTSATSAYALFAQGQGLMVSTTTDQKGLIDAAGPQFTYTAHPFPGGTGPNQTTTYLHTGLSLGVNAHSSAQAQAAAQTFIDFIARPKQNALYAQTVGGLTQYEFLKSQIPHFMSDFATVFKEHEYANQPTQAWWNANISLAFQQDAIGLITGQSTIDSVLNAMDAAWKQGPA